MIVTTTPEIAGKNIIEYKGIAVGEACEVHILKIFNNRLYAEALENKSADAKIRALNNLMNHAASLGANAVISINFNV